MEVRVIAKHPIMNTTASHSQRIILPTKEKPWATCNRNPDSHSQTISTCLISHKQKSTGKVDTGLCHWWLCAIKGQASCSTFLRCLHGNFQRRERPFLLEQPQNLFSRTSLSFLGQNQATYPPINQSLGSRTMWDMKLAS